MSSGVACVCPGTLAEKIKHWLVIDYKCNYSAFNGYHYTPSDYSAVVCTNDDCRGSWRTKADYVDDLPAGKVAKGKYVAK